MSEDEFLTPSEAARLKKVNPSAIYKAIAEGRIPSHCILKRLALKKSDVSAWTPMPNRGHPKGTPVTHQTRRRMSEAQKKRWQRLQNS